MERNERIAASAIVAVVAAAYFNALGGSFQFDDYNVIVDNPAVHSWSAWLASMPGIRPLLKASYTLNWTSGLGVVGFHLFNLATHAASAALVFWLARRWTMILAAPGTPALAAATTAALLFALHPAQTEAVTYVCGRSVSLMALLYLAAIAAHLRWAGDGGMRGWLSAALFVAALAVKETAVTLPFALMAWEIAGGAGVREALRRTRHAWLVLVCGAVAMLSTAGYQRLLDVSVTTRTLKENLLTQIDGVSYLLTQPLLLLRTNIDPGLAVRTTLTGTLALQALALSSLLAASILLLRRWPWVALGGVWVFLHLLPTNSLLPRLDVANDRQLYLALVGVAVPVSIALWRLRPALVPGALAGSLALLLAGTTIVRNSDYRSEVALWRATVARAPDNARAWNNLGFALHLEGNAAEARAAFLHALALAPDYAKARINLEALAPQPTDRP